MNLLPLCANSEQILIRFLNTLRACDRGMKEPLRAADLACGICWCAIFLFAGKRTKMDAAHRGWDQVGAWNGRTYGGVSTMASSHKLLNLFGAAGVALVAFATVAVADGYEYEPKAMEPPKEERKFTYSFSLWGTSDYVFRGISQTENDPTLQGAFDVGYGIFYAGVWGSGVDFAENVTGLDDYLEVDYYAGIKPTWGKAAFDFGVIYYWYPGDSVDLFELKAGVSGNLVDKLSVGTTFFYNPDYNGHYGVWEGSVGYEFHEIGGVTPTINGLVGYFDFYDNAGVDYTYWNAGLALAVGNITFDFRYWDTDAGANTCFGVLPSTCDERFVFTVGVSVP
jgi:uncharacterized protein (TIGR02001 family)